METVNQGHTQEFEHTVVKEEKYEDDSNDDEPGDEQDVKCSDNSGDNEVPLHIKEEEVYPMPECSADESDPLDFKAENASCSTEKSSHTTKLLNSDEEASRGAVPNTDINGLVIADGGHTHINYQVTGNNSIDTGFQPSVRETSLLQFTCSLCGEAFSNVAYLNKHLQENPNKECAFAALTYRSDSSKGIIYDATASSQKQFYKCALCEKTFKALLHMNEHKCECGEQLSHLCEFCGQLFRTRANLRIHRRIHMGSSPYVSNYYVKSFSGSGMLKHQRLIHTGEKHVSSQVCGKSFLAVAYLNAHNRVHTKGGPYKCDVCGKYFAQSRTVMKHKAIHTGEQQHTCDIRSQSFSETSFLEDHKYSHTGARPYACKICGRSFSASQYLKRHLHYHIKNG